MAEQSVKRNVKDTYCFGPTSIENGQKYLNLIARSGRSLAAIQASADRCGHGQYGEYYLIVAQGDGAGGSQGMTYGEIQRGIFWIWGAVMRTIWTEKAMLPSS